MNKQTLGKGASYLFIEAIVSLFSGFILWLLLSKIVTPDTIGNSSLIISFSNIFGIIATIGIPFGISHLLGKNLQERNFDYLLVYLKWSIIILALGIFATSAVIFIVKDSIYFFDITTVIFSILLIITTSIASLFRYTIIGSLDTRRLPVIAIVSTCVKIAFTILLVLMGKGVLGIIIGYLSYHLLSCFLFAFSVKKLFESFPKQNILKYRTVMKSLLKASIPNWIPTLITAIGSADLGLIILYGSSGASQAGSFFLAYAIYSAMAAIGYSLFTIALPLLSGMDDHRKALTSELIKISLMISIPISCSIIFQSYDVMDSFGKGYTDASISLSILLLSLFPFSFYMGITTLVYSYGNYRQVLLLGLASALPRTILYFPLSSSYGATGVALSYFLGTLIGFIIAIIISKRIRFCNSWKEPLALLALPLIVSYVFAYFNVHYILSVLATTLISLLLYLKLEILKRYEVEDTLNVLPNGVGKPIIRAVNLIGTKLTSKY